MGSLHFPTQSSAKAVLLEHLFYHMHRINQKSRSCCITLGKPYKKQRCSDSNQSKPLLLPATMLSGSISLCSAAALLLVSVTDSLVSATPLEVRQSSPTPLSASAVAALSPYTHYASTAYCTPAATMAWNCGGVYLLIFEDERMLMRV